MRFVDNSGLKSLSSRGGGPWQLSDELLLRTNWYGSPLRSEREAQELYEVYAATFAAGAGTPEPYEVVRVPDGYGVIVEYVKGIAEASHLILGSVTYEEAAADLVNIAKRMHAHTMHAGRDWKASFLDKARLIQPTHPEWATGDLVDLVESIPDSSCLLHGDLHVGNIVIRKGDLAIIDVEGAGYGSPLFDLAVARSSIMSPRWDEVALDIGREGRLQSLRSVMWDAILKRYFADAGADELAAIDAQLEQLYLLWGTIPSM